MRSRGTPARRRCRIGVGGWNFAPWRGVFYPQQLPRREELCYASRQLTSIEINATFYRTQRASSFERWYEETPADFVFAVKGPMAVSSRRALRESGPQLERFFASGVMCLGEKLGPLNWQLAPHKRFDAGEIDAFLGLLPRAVQGRPLRHAIEVRHESFRHPEFVALAREHGVAIVLAGDSRYPQIPDPTADFVYARIMGTRAGQKQGYAPAQLTRWAQRVRCWLAGERAAGLDYVEPEPAKRRARDVFLYVISGAKQRNPAAAAALIRRLAAPPRAPRKRRA